MRVAKDLLILFWAVAVPAPAEIRGTVRDAAGGERLALVRVTLACGERTESIVTGMEGRFAFAGDVQPGCVLTAHLVGYRPVRLELSGEAEIEIALTPDTLTRRESVDVREGAFSVQVEGSPSERVLRGVEMKTLAGVLVDDPLRAVQALPGVASSRDYIAQFSLRGAAFERTGVLLDGVLLHSPFHTVQSQEKTGSVSIINADLVEEMVLHAGAPPVQYYDRTAGALEMRLRDGSRAAPAIRVNAGVASTGVILEGPVGRQRRGSWLAAARKSYLQYLLRRSTADDWLAFGYVDAEGRFTWDLTPAQQVTLSILDGRSDLDRTHVRERLGLNSIMNGEYHATLASAAWRWAPASNVLVTQRLAWMRERAYNVNNLELELNRMGYGEWVWNGSVAWSWNPRSPFEAGGVARRLHDDGFTARYQFNPLALRRKDNWHGTGVRGGAFLRQLHTTRWITVGVGARIDGDSVAGPAAVSPHASLAVRLASRTRVTAAWSQAVQYPSLMVRFVDKMGNRFLAPERANHFVTGFEHLLDDRTRFRVETFYRADRDLIAQPLAEPRLLANGLVFVPPVSPPYVNSVRGSARGVELFLERRSANRLSGWLSYGWVKTRMRDSVTGATFPADSEQRHTVTLFGSWRVSPSVHFSARYSYGSNYPIPGFLRWQNGQYYLSDHRNTLRLPAYHRLDFRLNKSFHVETAGGWTWRGMLYAEVMNATNRRNTTFDAFNGFNSATGQAYVSFLKLFPVVPAAGLMIEWERSLRGR
ncbi:MAG: collagen-binding protein [Bryobacteraceae bacterium]|nr:MAG: collagen-binding protein [Bryobacteraceae bacterium]